jgi:5'-nucleotidase
MRILLSNDDGILAPGLSALHAAVASAGEVTVAAPDSPQSAAGHAITLTHPLSVQRVKLAGGFEGMSIDGRPADCVRLAIRNLMDHRPDLVLSGINAGNNVGINVFYSGTVAAAAEAAMFGIAAVAFSASMEGEVDFARIGALCRSVLDCLLAKGLSPGELVSVNIPALLPGQPRGVKVVRQSTAGIEDLYDCRKDEAGNECYHIGTEYSFGPCDDDTDVIALGQGYITVTPLHIDLTNHKQLKSLQSCNWPDKLG